MPVPEAVSKPHFLLNCHSERSEESRIFNELRSFTSYKDDGKIGLATADRGPLPRSPACKNSVGLEVLAGRCRREREPERPQAFNILITIPKILWWGNRAEKTLALGKLLAIL